MLDVLLTAILIYTTIRTILICFLIMNNPAKPLAPSSPPPQTLPRFESSQLLQGANVVEIEHAGQRYLLRVTRENKLILTK